MKSILLLLLLPLTAWAAPPTPVNTPVGHPLAPNPHTSIGLFWIYTDATTGRQSTAVTYKVLRCTSAACTPVTEVATGLTTADWQDTGRTASTTYGYCVKANDGADSACSPTAYVTTLAADSSMVQFPSTVWSDLLGPLAESAQIPFAFYTTSMTAQGQDVISKYPVVVPTKLLGTGATTSGSNILTGAGTKFLEQASASNPACLGKIQLGATDLGLIASVDSNTQITLVSNAPSTQSGGTIQTNVFSSTCGGDDPLSNWIMGNQLGYYDSMLSLWQIYFMTGDPQYLRGAIKGSEALFAGFMWLGRNRGWSDFSTTAGDPGIPPPRNLQLQGLMLLGMAGHRGVWDLIDDFLTRRYDTWVHNYALDSSNNFTYPREKGYMIMYTVWFVIAAPDSFPRSDGTVTSLNGATTVDGSLATGRKDFWRDKLNLDVPGFISDDQLPWGFWTDNGGSNATADGDYPYVQGTKISGPAQPFIQGLVADALGYCWRSTDLSTTARNAARKMVLRASAAMGHLSYNTNPIAQDTSKRWRTIWYFLYGGTRLNPHAFQYGADSFVLNDTPYSNAAILNRQSIPLMLSTFGWAWEMSGHAWYKTMGDEMANAAFAAVGENTGGTGDGLKSLCDSDANYKDFGQCFRTSARYFGNRLSSPSSLGTAPVVTMPSNATLTGGVNQVSLTASVACANTPCVYRWGLQEYGLINNPRYEPMPVFSDDEALSTKLSGLEPGTYKAVFYALDALGLEDHGTVSVTVGDGVFPPVCVIGYGSPSAEEQHQYFTTSSSLSGSVRCYSIAGRSITHSFTVTKPKDKSAATFTPSSTTGNVVTFTISGLSAGLWTITDTATDSGGNVRRTHMYIRHTAESQPSLAHNTTPTASAINQTLPVGSTSTRLYVVPRDPEGIVGYASPATGYTQGELGASEYLVTALTHTWSQTAGPVSATITTNTTLCTPLEPCVTGMTVAGTYTFLYTGTDQQGDAVTVSVNVVTQSGTTKCRWDTATPCQ